VNHLLYDYEYITTRIRANPLLQQTLALLVGMAPTAIVTAPDVDPGTTTATAAAAAAADMANPSLVVTKDGRIKMEDAPMAEPGPDEVLLHVRATGICGSDIHFWHHGRIGDITVEDDCILGHEGAAEVLSVGSNVTHLKAGESHVP